MIECVLASGAVRPAQRLGQLRPFAPTAADLIGSNGAISARYPITSPGSGGPMPWSSHGRSLRAATIAGALETPGDEVASR